MTVKTETRTLSRSPELRATGTGRTLTGYAAVFNSPADIGGAWIETIERGAFTRALEGDIVAIIGHDRNRVIGRTGAGTLRLSEDDKGLRFEIDLPDTTDGRDVAVSVERGDIGGMSFGFSVTRQQWDETTEPPQRTIQQVELYEITVTAFPAYPDTSVGLRSLDDARKEAAIAAREAKRSHIDRRLRMRAQLDIRSRA
ncbi:caudovirus prohead protease [Sphingomonas sp. MM-1]|uniref:HK97 family phage prohead protease n=1 Tax=Sphingomonas sp. MM-1 TaxID=745310 RepID=UPI0002C05FB9|nr:HK97 family phage prohead protease [Sphingomonas sp. MM-1]AGH48760.1 caudovirus prohead protease [Sphingomonas sp. MM-1]